MVMEEVSISPFKNFVNTSAESPGDNPEEIEEKSKKVMGHSSVSRIPLLLSKSR